MKMRLLPALMTTMCCCLTSSCVPFPTNTPVFPPMLGFVIDAEGYAVPNATVTASRGGFVKHAVTGPTGKFQMPGAMQWHYAMNAGLSGVTPPRWYWRKPPEGLVISAGAPGYRQATQTFPARTDHDTMLTMPDRIQIQLESDGSRPLPSDASQDYGGSAQPYSVAQPAP